MSLLCQRSAEVSMREYRNKFNMVYDLKCLPENAFKNFTFFSTFLEPQVYKTRMYVRPVSSVREIEILKKRQKQSSGGAL